MDNHLQAFSIKFVAIFVVFYIILGFGYGLTFTEVLLLSLLLGIIAYLLGDMFILPRTNHTIATVADFAIGWAIIYLYIANFTPLDNAFTPSLVSIVGITIFEMFFHRYISRTVLSDQRYVRRNFDYQTEIAEELDVDRLREEIHKKE